MQAEHLMADGRMRDDRPSVRAAIESCTILNALSQQERDTLEQGCFMAYANRGESIWLAGSPSEFSGIVGLGFVKLTRTTPHGQEVAVELLGPGQVFGLLIAIEGRPFPLNAVAVTSCWYLKVPTRVLMPLYHASPAFKDQIVHAIGPRLRQAHQMMSRLSSGTVEERIAAVLLVLADNYGQHKGDKARLKVPLTRQEIGEMAGTTVETTIRVMSKWQKDGLVTTQRQIITICSVSQLERLLSEHA